MVSEILDLCHKARVQMCILNKSEINPTIQQGHELEINSHTPEQNTPRFCNTRKLIHLIRVAYNQILQKPGDPSPHSETLSFKIHFLIKIPSMIKLLIASSFLLKFCTHTPPSSRVLQVLTALFFSI
jgi:hypothetical protein